MKVLMAGLRDNNAIIQLALKRTIFSPSSYSILPLLSHTSSYSPPHCSCSFFRLQNRIGRIESHCRVFEFQSDPSKALSLVYVCVNCIHVLWWNVFSSWTAHQWNFFFLKATKIGSESVKIILNSLKCNSTLTLLNLGGTYVLLHTLSCYSLSLPFSLSLSLSLSLFLSFKPCMPFKLTPYVQNPKTIQSVMRECDSWVRLW